MTVVLSRVAGRRYYVSGMLELALLMLDDYDHTGNETMVATSLLPIADG